MNFNYCPSCGKKGTVEQLDKTNYECTNCQWHFWNNAKAAVGIALVREEQVLVCRGAIEPVKGKTGLPGGFVDYGEDAYDAVIREMSEEAGITVKKEALTLIETYPYKYMPGVTTCDFIFAAREWKGTIQAQDDVAEFLWKPFEFIDSPDFDWPYHGLSKILARYWQSSK